MGIASRHGSPATIAAPRAKTIDHGGRVTCASRLLEAMRLADTKVADVARAWGISWVTTDALLCGAGPIGLERLDVIAERLPGVYEHYKRLLDETSGDRALVPPAPTTASLRLSGAKGDYDSALAEALAQGELSEERRRLLSLLAARVVTSAGILFRSVERVGR